jgi:protein ImuB
MFPLPDYPPVHFLYAGKIHYISKSRWPRTHRSEWWLESSDARDNIRVEDEEGARYCSIDGRYDDARETVEPQWMCMDSRVTKKWQ